MQRGEGDEGMQTPARSKMGQEEQQLERQQAQEGRAAKDKLVPLLVRASSYEEVRLLQTLFEEKGSGGRRPGICTRIAARGRFTNGRPGQSAQCSACIVSMSSVKKGHRSGALGAEIGALFDSSYPSRCCELDSARRVAHLIQAQRHYYRTPVHKSPRAGCMPFPVHAQLRSPSPAPSPSHPPSPTAPPLPLSAQVAQLMSSCEAPSVLTLTAALHAVGRLCEQQPGSEAAARAALAPLFAIAAPQLSSFDSQVR